MDTHVVLKRLPVGTKTLWPGDKVDAREWRNAPLLEAQRYIKPLESDLTFEQRVIETVIGDINANGPLAQAIAQLIQPDGRDKRMGRKDKDEPRN